MRHRWFSHCYFCGAKAVPCVDNFGQKYMGCSGGCVIVLPKESAK